MIWLIKVLVYDVILVISKEFRLRKSANIGHVSETFTEDWDNVLEDCSRKLQRLLLDEIPAVLTSIREQRQAIVTTVPSQQLASCSD